MSADELGEYELCGHGGGEKLVCQVGACGVHGRQCVLQLHNS